MTTIEVLQKAPPLPPVDPNVTLPPSVRAAAERVNAMYKPAEEGVTAAVTSPEPPLASAPAPVPAEPPLPPPAPAPVPAEPVVPPPAPAWKEGDTPPGDPAEWNDWEKRYNSMRGRFNQSHAQVTQLQDQMSAMAGEIMQLNAALRQAPVEPETPVITDELKEQYGEDLLNVVSRVAADAAARAVEPEIAQVRQTTSRTARHALLDALDRTVPEWQQINASPEFKRWMRLPDVYSRRLRSELAEEAKQSGDAPRLIAFFTGFLQEQALVTGQPTSSPLEPPAPAPRIPAVSLATLAAPGRARPAAGDAPAAGSADKPRYSRAQIQGFYADVRRGVYAGDPARKAAIENDIFAAQREGRVT